MDIILTVVITVFIFGVLVFIHELGHFLAAIKAGVYVEEFAFGFGPKLISKRWKNVDYRINLVPLGGYVKMLGDMDGSSLMRHGTAEIDKEDLKFVKDRLKEKNLESPEADYASVVKYIDSISNDLSEEQYNAFQDYLAYDFIPNHPQNFDNKGFLPRFIILVAGVFLNFVLGAFLFYVLFQFTDYTTDLTKIGNPRFFGAQTSNPPVLYEIYTEGFENFEGSLIHEINGQRIVGESQFLGILDENYNKEVDVLIENASGLSEINLVLTGEGINTNFDDEVLNKVVLVNVLEGSAAKEAGIEGGEIILALAEVPVETPEELRVLLDEYRGSIVVADIINNEGELVEVELKLPDPAIDEPVLGAVPITNSPFLESVLRLNYAYHKVLSGTLHGGNLILYNATALGNFISQAFEQKSVEPVVSQVNSIVAVVDVTFQLVRANNFLSLLNLVALLSIVLAFMNILPIPLFDGGHVMFLFIEKIRGKKISTETQNKVSKVFFILLIMLTVAIMLKDIFQFDWPQRIVGTVRGIIN